MKKKVILIFIIILLLIYLLYINITKNNDIKDYNKTYVGPTIFLNGEKTIRLKKGEKYVEPGYKAYDKDGIDITSKVSVSSSLDINKTGSYELVYKVKDTDGNTTTTTRYIDILSELDYNKKTIYFTFDDGPSNVTSKILKILKEENVKATFFVINQDEKYDYLIKEEYENGHTVGLHSYSHKYNKIYNDINSYIDDLNKIEKKVEKIINSKINIIRFPGGSSNTISNINMNKLIAKTSKMGYYYYDWNIASYDTSNISSVLIYNKVISQLNKHNYNTNIILMHDYKNNYKTVEALKKIIKYGKENGYKFSNITKYTPLVRHKY